MEQNKPQRQYMDFAGPPQGRMASYLRLAPNSSARPSPAVPALLQTATVPIQTLPKQTSIDITSHAANKIQLRPKPLAITGVSHPRQNKSVVLRRQAVHKSAVAIHKATHPKRKFKVEHALLAASFTLFVIGSGLAFTGWQFRQQQGVVAGITSEDQNEGISINGVITETEPTISQYRNYTVNSDQPRYVRIPELSINARVRKTGTDPTGQMQLPASIFDAGWLKDSASPGGSGVTVIGGHGLGPNRQGIFYNLQNLKPGNLIELERGDGTRVRYSVISVKPFSQLNIDEAKKASVPGKPGLSLFSYPIISTAAIGSAQQGIVVSAAQI